MNDRIATELQAGRTASIAGLTLYDLLEVQEALGVGCKQFRILADSRACIDREDTGEPWWVVVDEDHERHVVQGECAPVVAMHFEGVVERIEGPFAEPPVLAKD